MTSRDRTVLAVVLVLAIVIGGYLGFVEPKRSQAGKLQTQINNEQRALQDQETAVAQGLAARSTYASFYTELARLGEAVPANTDTPSLIYQIQNAASDSGLDFRTLTLSAPSSSAASTASTSSSATTTAAALGVSTQQATFTFWGSFFNVAGFVLRLERFVTATEREVAVSGRLMTLNSIAITVGPGGFPEIQAQITATSYLIPAATAPSAATSTPSVAPAGRAGATTSSSTTGAAAAAVVSPLVR